MWETVILCGLGLVMAEIYSRTRRPKLYAFLNSALGVGSMLMMRLITEGFSVTSFNSAFSAILGVPGTALIYIMNISGVV